MKYRKTLEEHAEDVLEESEPLVSGFIPMCVGKPLPVAVIALIGSAHRLLEAHNEDGTHTEACEELRDIWCSIAQGVAIQRMEKEDARDLN